MKKRNFIFLGAMIVLALAVLFFYQFTDLFIKSYSVEEIEFMAKAERELEKTLGEDVTISNMEKGGLYVGPLIVKGNINRVNLPFELQTDVNLNGFDYIGPYYSQILNIDAKMEMSELVHSVFNDEVEFSVSIFGDLNKDEYKSYEEIKTNSSDKIIYNINLRRSIKDFGEEQVHDESLLLYQLINEFKKNGINLQQIDIEYKKFSLRISALLDPTTNVTFQVIEDTLKNKLETLRKKTSK